MKRAYLSAVLLLTGCLDFDGLIKRCEDGSCVDAGAGGGSASGGGSAAGGGAATGGGSMGGGTAGGGDGGAPDLDGLNCSPPDGGRFCFNGFRWENPLPQGNDVSAIWGSAGDDVWMGAQANMLMHWDGTAWSSFQVPPALADDSLVHSVFGFEQQVYAGVSGGEPWVLDGGAFALLDGFPSYYDVLTFSGNSADGLWALTSNNPAELIYLRPDGGNFGLIGTGFSRKGTHMVADGFGSVLVSLAEGNTYTLNRCSSSSCTGSLYSMPLGTAQMVAAGNGDVITLLGDYSLFVAQLDGGVGDAGNPPFMPYGIWLGVDGGGVLTGPDLGISERGDDWGTPITTFTGDKQPYQNIGLDHAWIDPQLNEGWVSGPYGVLIHRHAPHSYEVVSTGQIDTLEFVALTASGLVASGSNAGVLRRGADDRWTVYRPGEHYMFRGCTLSDGGLLAGGQSSSGDAVVTEDLLTVNPTAQALTGGGDTSGGVTGLACLDDRSVAVAGDTVFVRAGGMQWAPVRTDTGRIYRGAAGFGDRHAAVIGDEKVLLLDADGGWVEHGSNANVLSAVWLEPDTGRVWVGGELNGAEYIGSLDAGDFGNPGVSVTPHLLASWPSQSSQIFAINGSSANDVWAGGSAGRLFHYDGTGFRRVEVGIRIDINAIAIVPTAAGYDLVLVGQNGMVVTRSFP
ncbi:MAG: hypothetical protein QM723_40055 [Myxococcaceae bacterium]